MTLCKQFENAVRIRNELHIAVGTGIGGWIIAQNKQGQRLVIFADKRDDGGARTGEGDADNLDVEGELGEAGKQPLDLVAERADEWPVRAPRNLEIRFDKIENVVGQGALQDVPAVSPGG